MTAIYEYEYIKFCNIFQNYLNIYCNISTTLPEYIAKFFSCNMLYIVTLE